MPKQYNPMSFLVGPTPTRPIIFDTTSLSIESRALKSQSIMQQFLDQAPLIRELFSYSPALFTFFFFHFFYFFVFYMWNVSGLSKTAEMHNKALELIPLSEIGWVSVHVVSAYPPDWKPPKEKKRFRVETINPEISLLKIFLLSSLSEVFLHISTIVEISSTIVELFPNLLFWKHIPIIFAFFSFILAYLFFLKRASTALIR